jgi:serine/threonine protein kinase
MLWRDQPALVPHEGRLLDAPGNWSMPYTRALKPGTMVAGEWHIERKLGQGGFGVTYEARHRNSGAHVALKEYMPSGLCTRIGGSTRVTPSQGQAGDVFKRGLAGFMKEADTLARLDHPSIVRVSGYFEANDTGYMALSYETGGTVAQWLESLGRPPTQAELDGLLWLLIDALIQVHSLPLLHRDIKPENIMLRADGTPVLIGFGAVKTLVSSDSRSVHGPATLDLVTDGYAPPEHYVGEGVALLGPWSDVYALGATLYQAVTGAKPASATQRMVEGNHRPLTEMPLGKLGAGWRPEFLEGVDKALALKRSDRPQSMVEFRRAIGLAGGRLRRQQMSPAGPAGPASPLAHQSIPRLQRPGLGRRPLKPIRLRLSAQGQKPLNRRRFPMPEPGLLLLPGWRPSCLPWVAGWCFSRGDRKTPNRPWRGSSHRNHHQLRRLGGSQIPLLF